MKLMTYVVYRKLSISCVVKFIYSQLFQEWLFSRPVFAKLVNVSLANLSLRPVLQKLGSRDTISVQCQFVPDLCVPERKFLDETSPYDSSLPVSADITVSG